MVESEAARCQQQRNKHRHLTDSVFFHFYLLYSDNLYCRWGNGGTKWHDNLGGVPWGWWQSKEGSAGSASAWCGCLCLRCSHGSCFCWVSPDAAARGWGRSVCPCRYPCWGAAGCRLEAVCPIIAHCCAGRTFPGSLTRADSCRGGDRRKDSTTSSSALTTNPSVPVGGTICVPQFPHFSPTWP